MTAFVKPARVSGHAWAKVLRGAAWLDEHRPNWRDHVELMDLDLSSACRCVLGQVFATDADVHPFADDGFDFVVDVLHPTEDRWAVDRGFDAEYERGGRGLVTNFDELYLAWTAVIDG